MTTWKAVERRIARALGTERTGPTGVPQPDCQTDWLVVEIKHREKLPAWLKSAVEQARRHCGDKQLGIAVLHEKHKRTEDSLVVLRFGDFLEWFGDAGD